MPPTWVKDYDHDYDDDKNMSTHISDTKCPPTFQTQMPAHISATKNLPTLQTKISTPVQHGPERAESSRERTYSNEASQGEPDRDELKQRERETNKDRERDTEKNSERETTTYRETERDRWKLS